MTILPFSRSRDIVSWLIWIVVLLALLLPPLLSLPASGMEIWQSPLDPVPGLGPGLRWRWCVLRRWVRFQLHRWGAGLVLAGRLWACQSLAEVLQVLTRRQVVRYLGALPVLVALLERLRVRQIINHYCPTRSPVDHGAVGLVLVLNRLMAPRPLYGLVDWLATTWISQHLDIPPEKFNDDRLGRSLDALNAHRAEIWEAIQQQALHQFRIDLSVLFYDLTALVMTGSYAGSQLVDYGFANNTPKDDPKLKLGVVLSRMGGIPWLFRAWSARTSDQATVKANLAQLRTFLLANGWSLSQVLLVGDSSNLNSELAIAYSDAGIRYLAGLPKLESPHRRLVEAPNERDFTQLELAPGYGGVPVEVPFSHGGRSLTQRGLVVRSEILCQQVRRERTRHLHQLAQALHQIQTRIGQKRYNSQVELQRRVDTQLKHSPVAQFFHVQVVTSAGRFSLEYWMDADALQVADHKAGRFLLVTNDPDLDYERMLALYRQKDGLEKRFEVVKQDLLARPLRVHSDERIQAMLLLNLIALLAYSLLEHQAAQTGICLTARRILEKLSSLQMQGIEAWDGSWAFSWQETHPGQVQLLSALLKGLDKSPWEVLPSGALRSHLLPAGMPPHVDPGPERRSPA